MSPPNPYPLLLAYAYYQIWAQIGQICDFLGEPKCTESDLRNPRIHPILCDCDTRVKQISVACLSLGLVDDGGLVKKLDFQRLCQRKQTEGNFQIFHNCYKEIDILLENTITDVTYSVVTMVCK